MRISEPSAFIEFDEGVGRPEALKFLPGNELPWFFEKNEQRSKRLVLKPDADAMPP